MNERKTHMRYQLVATMAAGLESVTTKELKALGIQTRTENGKVYFEGDDKTIALTNVWLRSADRIKIVVGQFNGASPLAIRYPRLNRLDPVVSSVNVAISFKIETSSG